MPHINQSLSFKVIKPIFSEYSAVLSLQCCIFNPHTTNSAVVQP